MDVDKFLPDDRVVELAHRCGHRGKEVETHVAGASAAPAAADRRPFVHERGQGNGPSLVHIAEAMVVGHAHVGEEHLVERCSAGHLAKWSNLHAGSVHVDDEPGESLVFGKVRIRAADDLTEVGELCSGGPHLLAGNDPFVSVTFGFRLQTRQVRSRSGLGEQLAPDDVAAPHLGEVGVFRRVRCMGEDRRRNHAQADLEHTEIGGCEPRRFVVVHPLIAAGKAAAAELCRSGDPSETGVEHRRAPRLGVGDVAAFGFGRLLLEHRDLVAAFAPLAGGFLLAGFAVRSEEVACLGAEGIFGRKAVGHCWSSGGVRRPNDGRNQLTVSADERAKPEVSAFTFLRVAWRGRLRTWNPSTPR